MSVLSRALRLTALTAVCGLLVPSLALARPVQRRVLGPRVAVTARAVTRGVTQGVTRGVVPAAPRTPPPPPTVPVQVAGVRPGPGRPWVAAAHAIRRDALPGLYACAVTLRDARGMVHVELSQRESGAWVVSEVSSARRDRALESCVRRAAERIVVPPSDADALPVTTPTPSDNQTHPTVQPSEPAPGDLVPGAIATAPAPAVVPAEDLVAFDLAFGMPSLTARRP